MPRPLVYAVLLLVALIAPVLMWWLHRNPDWVDSATAAATVYAALFTAGAAFAASRAAQASQHVAETARRALALHRMPTGHFALYRRGPTGVDCEVGFDAEVTDPGRQVEIRWLADGREVRERWTAGHQVALRGISVSPSPTTPGYLEVRIGALLVSVRDSDGSVWVGRPCQSLEPVRVAESGPNQTLASGELAFELL